MSQGPARNKPCPCGSGKKFKHCCLARKHVSQVVGIEFETPQAIQGVQIGPGGSVRFLPVDPNASAKSAWISSHRDRQKGEKVLLRADADPSNLHIGEASVLSRYQYVFGIDTNTRSIRGRRVSVAIVNELRFRQVGPELIAEHAVLGGFEMHDVHSNAEQAAWHMLIGCITHSPDHKLGNTYAIVSDSDLANHTAYNQRQNPYFETHLLPENFKIIYAADEGRALTNNVIKSSDKEARRMLNEIEAGLVDSHITAVSGTAFTHFRGYLNDNPDFLAQNWFRLGIYLPYSTKHPPP